MNFESPYVDMPMRLTVRQNLTIFGRLYAVTNLRARIATARFRPRSRRFPRPRQRQTLRRAEDPRRAGESADQPAGTAAAGRADGVARSRYRRLGQAASGDLSQGPRRHHPAGLAQHAGGRAAVRPRHHHETRPHRGRRQPRSDHGPLQPRHAGGSVSRRRARPRAGRARHERSRHHASRASRCIASTRWCCATGIC